MKKNEIKKKIKVSFDIKSIYSSIPAQWIYSKHKEFVVKIWRSLTAVSVTPNSRIYLRGSMPKRYPEKKYRIFVASKAFLCSFRLHKARRTILKIHLRIFNAKSWKCFHSGRNFCRKNTSLDAVQRTFPGKVMKNNLKMHGYLTEKKKVAVMFMQ